MSSFSNTWTPKALLLLLALSVLLTVSHFLMFRKKIQGMTKVKDHIDSKKGDTGCLCSCGKPIQFVVGKDATNSSMLPSNEPYWELIDILRSNSVEVKIVNAEPMDEYSVLAVLAGSFSKAGIRKDLSQQLFHLELPFAGKYSVLVHVSAGTCCVCVCVLCSVGR